MLPVVEGMQEHWDQWDHSVPWFSGGMENS